MAPHVSGTPVGHGPERHGREEPVAAVALARRYPDAMVVWNGGPRRRRCQGRPSPPNPYRAMSVDTASDGVERYRSAKSDTLRSTGLADAFLLNIR